jgi:hypothetical protein
MKKGIIALVILLLCALVYQANAASYYGCASAAINADNTFCTTPTGSCTGTTAVSAATALAGTHTLFANGCTITIPNNANVTVGAAKLSNKDDGGDMVDGGQFTYVTSASYTLALNADLETGGTTGAVLAISGSAAGAARVTITTTSAGITGGSASVMNGVTDAHTVGEVVVNATNGGINGGSNSAAHGYTFSGSTGTLTITGNATGVIGYGISVTGAGSTINMTGDCIGSGSYNGAACSSTSTGAFTVEGNLINGTRGTATVGSVRWSPTAPSNGVTGHYVKFDGGGTAVYAGKNTDDASKALSTFYYIDPSDGTSDQGSASTTGGGAWAW